MDRGDSVMHSQSMCWLHQRRWVDACLPPRSLPQLLVSNLQLPRPHRWIKDCRRGAVENIPRALPFIAPSRGLPKNQVSVLVKGHLRWTHKLWSHTNHQVSVLGVDGSWVHSSPVRRSQALHIHTCVVDVQMFM